MAVVSHELRTPLTSIQGYIKTLLQLADDVALDQRETFLRAADRQSDRLGRLIEQTLIVARLESHVEPILVSSVSLPDVVQVVVAELEPLAHGHAFDVRIATEDGTVAHRRRQGAPDRLEPHRERHEVLPSRHADHRPRGGRVQGVLVAVEDEGPGIAAEQRERVFDRFYQVDQTATRKVGGTGLGLYICRKLAEEIGARIWLEPSEVRGSVFCLFVPRTPRKGRITDEGPEPGQSMTASV